MNINAPLTFQLPEPLSSANKGSNGHEYWHGFGEKRATGEDHPVL